MTVQVPLARKGETLPFTVEPDRLAVQLVPVEPVALTTTNLVESKLTVDSGSLKVAPLASPGPVLVTTN